MQVSTIASHTQKKGKICTSAKELEYLLEYWLVSIKFVSEKMEKFSHH